VLGVFVLAAHLILNLAESDNFPNIFSKSCCARSWYFTALVTAGAGASSGEMLTPLGSSSGNGCPHFHPGSPAYENCVTLRRFCSLTLPLFLSLPLALCAAGLLWQFFPSLFPLSLRLCAPAALL